MYKDLDFKKVLSSSFYRYGGEAQRNPVWNADTEFRLCPESSYNTNRPFIKLVIIQYELQAEKKMKLHIPR